MGDSKKTSEADAKHIERMTNNMVQVASSLRRYADFPSAEDNKLALSLYERAGNLGHAAGMAGAASMYSSGAYGIEQDPVKAEALYKQALELGGGVTSYSAAGWLYEMKALEANNERVLLEQGSSAHEQEKPLNIQADAFTAFDTSKGVSQAGDKLDAPLHVASKNAPRM